MSPSAILSENLENHGSVAEDKLRVQVSYELISLLSKQLYSSPAKALEELIVNAWDADADSARSSSRPRLLHPPRTCPTTPSRSSTMAKAWTKPVYTISGTSVAVSSETRPEKASDFK